MTSLASISDEPLRLPPAPAPAASPPFPLISAVVPVVGAAVLWIVTGSPAVLWFAALGPLLAVAGLLDGRRGARRARRRDARDLDERLAQLRDEVAARHDRERRMLWARHPDVMMHLAHPDETWRVVPGRDDMLVAGRGTGSSAVRLEGAVDSATGRRLRDEAHTISDVPVLVPLDAGIAVVGPVALATAVARALVLQACLNLPPGRLRVVGVAQEWCLRVPHRRATTGATLRLVMPGETVGGEADVPIVVVGGNAPPPPRCAAVLTLLGPHRARLDHGGLSQEVVVDAVTTEQASEISAALTRRAAVTHGAVDDAAPPLSELLQGAPSPTPEGLPAVIGTAAGAPVIVDLVADGPHAVVIGVTGSGKSELLTTWVAAIAATHAPNEASFLLVDFKGGRTFDALTALPHVTGVLTDLDDAAALRAIESLRAELRHRERTLAEVGARDVAEAAGALSRLIVVVDEYAALVAAHPALHELFGDIAARGRALGVHLVLASQRAAGVFRDAVLANTPLRLALRVTDAADSRAVLGVDDAAALSGRGEDRGVCLVRRAADAVPRAVRVSRCGPDVLTHAADAGAPARRPWLPPLPERIDLSDLAHAPAAPVIGIADEPEQQRQRPVVLTAAEPGLIVIGAAGSGRSAVLRAVAHQVERVVRIPADAEAGWDAVGIAEQAPPTTAVVADDLDLLLARLPHDHAGVLCERLERLAREARARGIQLIASMQRPAGQLSRVVDAIPRRLLLTHASRADYVAAGGAAADFLSLPPGRGHLDGVLVQTPWTPVDAEQPMTDPPPWQPSRHPVAFVAPAGPATRSVLETWAARGIAVAAVDEAGAQLRSGSVLWGTPDAWLAQWRLLSAARAEAQLVIDAACAAEYRAVTGARELPPYARARARRAWLYRPDEVAARIVLPGG